MIFANELWWSKQVSIFTVRCYVGQNRLISLGLRYGVMLVKICIVTVRVHLFIYLFERRVKVN